MFDEILKDQTCWAWIFEFVQAFAQIEYNLVLPGLDPGSPEEPDDFSREFRMELYSVKQVLKLKRLNFGQFTSCQACAIGGCFGHIISMAADGVKLGSHALEQGAGSSGWREFDVGIQELQSVRVTLHVSVQEPRQYLVTIANPQHRDTIQQAGPQEDEQIFICLVVFPGIAGGT